MEPELLVTARAVLEPSSEREEEEEEEEEREEEVQEDQDDRATALQIAQLLRVNKYRWGEHTGYLVSPSSLINTGPLLDYRQTTRV